MEDLNDSAHLPSPTNLKPWPPAGIDWYYADSHTAIALGDCREILPQLEPVDLVLTDPPYRKTSCGTGIKSLGGMLSRNRPLVRSGGLFMHNDLVFADWLPLLFSALRDCTHAYVFCDYLNTKELLIAADDSGFQLCNCRPMVKSNCVTNKYGMLDYELAWMFRKGTSKNITDCGVKSVIYGDAPQNKLHPTEKPLNAVSQLIRDSSSIGQSVLDLFMGSGTTLRAAKNLGRKAIGIEIEEKYCEIAAKRLVQEVLNFSVD